MKTASEHFDWCVQRAEEYLNMGNPEEAVASFLSDMSKHEGTKDRVPGFVAVDGILFASKSVDKARRWIEGFPRP